MESYNEYPIRCKTCNTQIACHSDTYISLLAHGYSREQAANELRLFNWCCRSSMLTPTVVFFNMENRAAIEGLVSVENVDQPSLEVDAQGNPVFGGCLFSAQKRSEGDQYSSAPINIEVNRPIPVVSKIRPLGGAVGQTETLQQKGVIVRSPGVQPGITPQSVQAQVSQISIPIAARPQQVPPLRPGAVLQPKLQSKLQSQLQPKLQSQLQPKLQSQLSQNQNHEIPISDIFDAVDVEAPPGPFEEPKYPGIPTYNRNPTISRQVIRLSENKETEILNGRTYLAV